MTLPADGSQDKLIESIAAVNKNVIVVNTTGVPVDLPWLENVSAFLQAWYAGQKTGNAILDVLLGVTTPSGKLPVSWPKKNEHTGCYGHFGLDSYESRKVEYVEGEFIGYRWFDRLWGHEKEVRFPFGYGLSYTSFNISGFNIEGRISNDPCEKVKITAQVKNTGLIKGSETVQIYLQPPVVKGVERPIKTLVGFAKLELQTGEEKVAEVEFLRDGAAYWDERKNCWAVSEGEYKVLVATSSGAKDVKGILEMFVDEDFSFGP